MEKGRKCLEKFKHRHGPQNLLVESFTACVALVYDSYFLQNSCSTKHNKMASKIRDKVYLIWIFRIDPSMVFSIFHLDHLGKIRRHQ